MKLRKFALLLAAWPALALAGSPAGVLPQIGQPQEQRQGNPALPRPLIAPAPGWVDVAPLPKAPSGAEGAATIDLLGDVQVLFGKDEETTYYGVAWIIGTAHGLDSGSLKVEWDPSLEVVTIHHYRVVRDGQAIDLLGDGSKLKVIQRETRMESAMLDGRLTATLQPEDLRVGDVVELSYSTVRRDPATKGMAEYISGPADGSTYGRFRVRMVWGKDKQVQWRASPGILKPKLKKTPQGTELVAELFDVTAPRGPEGAPQRYALVNAVEVTEFKDWQGVSRLFAPIYAHAAQLAPDSKIKAEAAKIAAQTTDPKRRAELALGLVQDQVRYLFLGMDAGGYIPASAEQTWARRFGDCKGKTVLLIALLNELGIEARPVLVHTEDGDLVANRLPAMGAFDHVIVEAKIGGKSYWLDGTRLGDDKLDRLEPPLYKVGLPVTVAGSPLVPILPPELTRPTTTVALTIDASKGLAVAAPVSGEMRFSGTFASDVRQKFAGLSQADRNRELRRIWRESFDMVTPVKVATVSDPETGDYVLTMSGTAQMDWTADLGTKWYEIDRSRLGWRIDIAREGEINPDAPYAFSYPDWWSSRVTITLPNAGKGFRVQGSDPVDKTVGDLFHFRRKVAFKDGVVTMEADTRALAAELPAARAQRTRAEMVELSNGSVYIRAPVDYEPTEAEKEQTRRADAAEAEAAKAKANGKVGK
jgi:transglutaminase-like putative cysteine protease